jgi:hypothetical protein
MHAIILVVAFERAMRMVKLQSAMRTVKLKSFPRINHSYIVVTTMRDLDTLLHMHILERYKISNANIVGVIN